jgi:predicted site-specific integrase-resolvase
MPRSIEQQPPVMALCPAAAARVLNVSLRTLWVWVREGKLTVVRPSVGVTLVLMSSIRRLLGESG